VSESNRLLVVGVPGLSYGLATKQDLVPRLTKLGAGGAVLPVEPSFPAVVSTVQAAVTTGASPSYHGIVSNGYYDRTRLQVGFGEDSDRLVEAQRVWEVARDQDPGFTSAMLFWQNSVGSSNDIILTPKPIRRSLGGRINCCYARPKGLYEVLVDKIGRFCLSWHQGPRASRKSSAWIAQATRIIIEEHSPNLVLTSLPSLAYCLPRQGLNGKVLPAELSAIDGCLAELLDAATKGGYTTMVVGECAMDQVDRAVFPNRVLREHEMLLPYTVAGMDFLDYGQSHAFAMVDHQIAHVYCGPQAVAEVYTLLSTVPGIERILTLEHQAEHGIDHPRSGELVLIAAKGYWFAYPWWHDAEQRPNFATRVDPRSKPGSDPLELFWEGHPFRVAQNPSLLRGSHGRLPDGKGAHLALVTNLQAARGEEIKDTDLFSLIIEGLGLSPVEPSIRA